MPKVIEIKAGAMAAKVAAAAKAINEGDRSIERAGRLLLEVQEEIGTGLAYQAALRKGRIAESTARRAVQFATDADAAKRHREKDEKRNREKRARTSERNPPKENKRLRVVRDDDDDTDEEPPKLIFEDPCTDCTTEEERWQRSFSVLAGDAISMSAYWTKEFGKWDAFGITSDMVALAEQAAASWQQMAVQLKQRKIK